MKEERAQWSSAFVDKAVEPAQSKMQETPAERGVGVMLEDLRALRNAFMAFDADSDGKLTEEEVVAALTRKTGKGTELSEEAARATWQRWLKEFDLNDDGKIHIMEIMKVREEFGKIGLIT